MVSWAEWAKHVNKTLADQNKTIATLNDHIRALHVEVGEIRGTLRTLMKPLVKQRILAVMLKEKKPRSECYIRRRVRDFMFAAFGELRQDGAFIETWSGPHHMYTLQTCSLCRLVTNVKAGRPIPSKLHFHDCKMVVVDCRTCKPAEPEGFQPKMVIYVKHGEQPSTLDKVHMRRQALTLFPGHVISLLRASTKDHYHFFVR